MAIREGLRDVTFRDLRCWSQAISRGLEPAIREPGQCVALMLGNSAGFVAAFFAVARAGGVVSPLTSQYRSREFAYYLNDLDAVALVTAPEFLERAFEIMPHLRNAPALVEVSDGHRARVVQRGGGRGQPIRAFASAPLLQQYTSGSTGPPKRVIRTHANLLAELAALRSAFDVSERDRFLGVAPFSHVNGLVRTMMTSMAVGATLYPIEGFRRREILDLITRERITFFGGMPQMFALLSQTPPRGDVDLSALRVVFSSSAPLLAVDNQCFHSRYGVFVRQLYGSTETGTISFNRHPSPERYLQSVGVPLEGVRVDVVDGEGTPLPPGREGELAIASPFAASEYLGNPAATHESFRGDFYFSGDFGITDAAGYLTITGRKNLLLNRGGFKVNPYEVEAAIKEHPKVVDVAVFGAPGSHGDDIVCCLIVASEPCTVAEILSHCRERIADFKIPARIEFRGALPTTGTGKVLRSELGLA